LQKEKEVNNYQPLPTIAMIMSGQQLSKIAEGKRGQQLTTINNN